MSVFALGAGQGTDVNMVILTFYSTCTATVYHTAVYSSGKQCGMRHF